MNRKKIIRISVYIVLALVLLLGLYLAWTKVIVPLFDSEADEAPYVADIRRYASSDEEFELDSDNIHFELNPDTTHFTVTDKRTGKVWSSEAVGVDDTSTALNEKNRLKSVFTLKYKNSAGKEPIFTSYEYSAANALYNVEWEDEDQTAIRVTFTVGNIPRIYMYPPAITEEDMKTILANVTVSKDKRTIENAYQLKGEGKYGKKDDVAALQEQYPDLLDTRLWILINPDMRENEAAKLEKAFFDNGYTVDDYERDFARLVQTEEEENATDAAVFTISVVYRLDGDDLLVEVPLQDIRYNPTAPITALTLLPAFGSANDKTDGYILVPEGTGALIRFNNGKTKQSAYYANMYGIDWATVQKEITNETRITFPAFGMATEGSSFLCILEDGRSWAGISANIPGQPNYEGAYNSASATYTLIHGDSYDVAERSNSTVFMFEQNLPEGKLSQRYRFVASDDYMDMATAYREYLMAAYPEMNRVADSESVTVVDMVGAIDKVQQRFGVPTNVPIPLTDYKQATELLNKLIAENLPNLTVRYSGWMNGGLNQDILNKIRLMSEMGKESDLKAFAETAKNAGVPLYLDGLTSYARDSGLAEGFLALRDAAQFTTREEVEIPEFSPIWAGPQEWRDTYYLLKPSLIMSNTDVLSNAVNEYGAAGVSLRDIGYLISADYNPKAVVTREEVRLSHMQKLQELHTKGQLVMTRSGNDYAVPYSDIVTDIDFDGGRYQIIDEYVPFYAAVLHGTVPYTGEAYNLARDREELLLRSAEMGASLQFCLMAGNVEELQDSWFSEYYGADVERVYPTMIQTIREYNEKMSGTFDQLITDHERTGEVAVTTFENGTRVYVNYGYSAVEMDGLTLEARSYQTVKEAIE